VNLSGWVREPILHFLLLGFALFLANDWWNTGDSESSKVIVVDSQSLGEFVQFRTQSFSGNAKKKLESLSPSALRDVVDQFVEEEALYRKALAYGMDRQDYVIKRRLVQKMEFLAEGTTPTGVNLTSAELRQYYEVHSAEYELPAAMTFTHVFFSADRHGENLEQLASETLSTLNNLKVRFDQAPNYGERFPYQLNYVERTRDEVAGHFGTAMAKAVFQLQPDALRWQGPIPSSFGLHLVLITKKQSARIPTILEIRNEMASEVQRLREVDRKKSVISALISEFEIEIAPEFKESLSEPP
jgi:hypothetical protein